MKKMTGFVVMLTLLLCCASAQAGFIDHGDGTVTDTSTGLMWQKATASHWFKSTYTWYEAQVYCDGLTLAGYHDWRLPDRNELESLVEYSRSGPSINTTYFPDTKAYYYWSLTPGLRGTGRAWRVGFGKPGGPLEINNRNIADQYYVRAVRSGQ